MRNILRSAILAAVCGAIVACATPNPADAGPHKAQANTVSVNPAGGGGGGGGGY